MMFTLFFTIEHLTKPEPQQLDGLLTQTAMGDQRAFSALYHATRAAVYGLSLSILKHTQDAQDVTQDTFVRIWENAGSYRADGSPMAWILTIARNLSLTKLRQKSKFIDLDDAEWNAIPADQPTVSAEDRLILQDALSVLSSEERQIVLIHAVAGLKHREIADLLQLPLSTVLSKYHRALKKMNTHLKGDDIR